MDGMREQNELYRDPENWYSSWNTERNPPELGKLRAGLLIKKKKTHHNIVHGYIPRSYKIKALIPPSKFLI
jgi:hypothetical protein